MPNRLTKFFPMVGFSPLETSMETLVERMLELLRRDPSLALYDNPFPLKEAGLVTKDLPESWDFAAACRAFEEAKRIMREEAQGD